MISWKKNALSYGLWAVYLSAAGFVFYRTGIEVLVQRGMENRLLAACVTFLFVMAVVLVFAGCRKLSAKMSESNKTSGRHPVIVKCLVLTLLLAVGLMLRIACIAYSGEEAAYFDTAKIVEGTAIPQVAHGATYFYLLLLHGLFYIIGNHWMAGIWLQIALQLMAVILLYLSVRKLAGETAAVVTAAFMMLDPVMILEGLTYSPRLLYLCIYAVGLLCVTGFLEKYYRDKMCSVYDIILLIFCGIAAAFVCYMDLSGITLLVFGTSVLWIKKKDSENRWSKPLMGWTVFMASTMFFFFLIVALDALASKKPFMGVLNAWFSLYQPKGFGGDFWMQAGSDYIMVLFISGLMLLGAAAFWLKKGSERLSPWALVLIVVCIMEYCHISATGMEGAGLLYWICVVLGGIGLSESFSHMPEMKKKTVKGWAGASDRGLTIVNLEDGFPEELTQEDEPESATKAMKETCVVPQSIESPKSQPDSAENCNTRFSENNGQDQEKILYKDKMGKGQVKEMSKNKKHHSSKTYGLLKKHGAKKKGKSGTMPEDSGYGAHVMAVASEEEPSPQVKMIDNPLPLPKKHVKKVMGYHYEPDEKEMDYDYQVKDDDDFDI